MTKDNVIDLKKPELFIDDPITDILRQGARRLLTDALEAEIKTFLKQYIDISNDKGRQRIVRNSYLPEREIRTYEAKYPKAATCLQKDRDALLTFYDFPAEHWIHIRTTNPIESTFFSSG